MRYTAEQRSRDFELCKYYVTKATKKDRQSLSRAVNSAWINLGYKNYSEMRDDILDKSGYNSQKNTS